VRKNKRGEYGGETLTGQDGESEGDDEDEGARQGERHGGSSSEGVPPWSHAKLKYRGQAE